MLLEAFSVKEISNEVNVSTTVLYHFFSKNGISIPNCKERIRILNSNGLSLDEIKKRMKIDSITVEKHYRNLYKRRATRILLKPFNSQLHCKCNIYF